METTTLAVQWHSTWPCKSGMYPKCLQMLGKQDVFQKYIFFDEMSSDHRRTWKKNTEQYLFNATTTLVMHFATSPSWN